MKIKEITVRTVLRLALHVNRDLAIMIKEITVRTVLRLLVQIFVDLHVFGLKR